MTDVSDEEQWNQYCAGRVEARICIGKKLNIGYLRHMQTYPGFSECFREGFRAEVDEFEFKTKHNLNTD